MLSSKILNLGNIFDHTFFSFLWHCMCHFFVLLCFLLLFIPVIFSLVTPFPFGGVWEWDRDHFSTLEPKCLTLPFPSLHSIRFFPDSKTLQIWCIVELKRDKIYPTMHLFSPFQSHNASNLWYLAIWNKPYNANVSHLHNISSLCVTFHSTDLTIKLLNIPSPYFWQGGGVLFEHI